MEKVTDVKGVLQPGLTLHISAGSSYSDSMTADIAAVTNSGFAITIPVKDGYFHPLTVDTKIEAYFYSGTGKYFLSSIVRKRIFFNEQPVLVIEMPKLLLRTERRAFYRVDTLFPVKIVITELVGEGDLLHVEVSEYKAKCTDISGGGMLLDCQGSQSLPLKLNEEFEIDFCEALPGLRRVKGVGVREPAGSAGWGIKFTKMADSDRDKIIRYVFKKQFSGKQLEEK